MLPFCVIGALDSKRVLNTASMSLMNVSTLQLFLASLLNKIVIVLYPFILYNLYFKTISIKAT